MAYLTPIHRPSDSRIALKLNLIDPEEKCLAVARYNRLEIYTYGISPDVEGQPVLNLVASQSIYGRIIILNKFRPQNSLVDQLFIGTDRSHFFTLGWDPKSGRLSDGGARYKDLADRVAREVQTGERSIIDPQGEFLVLEVYEGILTVIPLAQRVGKKEIRFGIMGDPSWSRIPEFHVKSSAFIQRPRNMMDASDLPKLALLWEDSEQNARIKIRQIYFASGQTVEFKDRHSDDAGYDKEKDTLDFGASHLIPIQEEPYGLIVLGETSISYYDDEEFSITRSNFLPEATIWATWERIDNQRYILADDFGRLSLLMLKLDGSNAVVDCLLDELGTTSRASCLVYLGDGFLFVGSHHGDSQVVQIQEKSLTIIQTLSNIAPILDFTVMDMGNRSGDGPGNEFSTGQARIVTGSGAWLDGSIRSVRSGVGVQEVALLEDMNHITSIFSLKSGPSSSKVDSLLLGFAEESRLFVFESDGGVREVDNHNGIVLNEPTLYASNLPHDQILQVTNTSVRLLDLDSGMQSASWFPPGHGQLITSASATDRNLVVSAGGETLVVLHLLKNLAVQNTTSLPSDKQISCIATSRLMPNACLVGLWQDSMLSILSLDTLKPLKTVKILDEESVVPRSILVSQIFPDSNPTLLVSMADGHIITYDINPSTYELKSKKMTILGTRQAELSEVQHSTSQTCSVFVASEHPSLIYAEEGRLTFSAVEAENVNCVCAFDSEEFPGSVAIASTKDLLIGVIDSERTTYVHPLHVGEVPRRLAYSPSLKAFGVGTIKRKVEDGAEILSGTFQLVDEVAFKKLDAFPLNQDEMVEAAIRAELDDGYGQLRERFIVGTSFLDDSNVQQYRGRILVLEVRDDRKLRMITSLNTKGACRCLALVDGHIVAALEKNIVVYSYEFTQGRTPYLEKGPTFKTSTIPVDMCVNRNEIAVADLMKSVSILLYKRKDPTNMGKDSLTEIARHVETVWATAVDQVGPDTWLESDSEGNLLVLSRNKDGVTEDDRRRLRVDSEFRLGEIVNRIRSIDVKTTSSAPILPKAFVATREGALYLFGLIADDKQNFLINLQENLASRVESAGQIEFMEYRAFSSEARTEEQPKRFVDGGLVELFLDCKPEVQEACIKGLMLGGKQVTVEQAKDIVDHLRRLH